MRLFPPPFRRFARRLALLGGLVFVGIAYVGPWAQERLSERVGRVARTDLANSRAAYETLLALDDSALGVLVENAATSDPRIAESARHALAVRVDTWRAQDATGGSFRVARHVDRLLVELEKQVPKLTYSGKAWATRFANHLLETASLVPLKERGVLIASVDHLLNTLATTPTLPDPPTPPAALVEADPKSTPLTEPRVAEIETESVVPIVESIPPPPVSSPKPKTIVANDPPQQSEEAWQPAWRGGQAAEPVPREPVPNEPVPSELAANQLEPKSFVALPAEPLALADDNYSIATDQQLLAALLKYEGALRDSQQPQARGPNAKPSSTDPLLAVRLESLGHALQSRGYRGVSLTHVRQLLSKSVSDRIQLVEQLLVGRTGDTARLLLLLAQDESPDVRVAAITALGSSPRKELVEAAWALALRDKDARVARVAEQINQRRQ